MDVKESKARVLQFALLTTVVSFGLMFITGGGMPILLTSIFCISVGYGCGAFLMMRAYKQQLENALKELSK